MSETVRNDTFGEITREMLAALREVAHPCLRCGLLADVDPVAHAARYGHRPAYRDARGTWEFSPLTLTWIPVQGAEGS